MSSSATWLSVRWGTRDRSVPFGKYCRRSPFVFSLGMTALLVAVGLSSGLIASLPKPGRWTGMVKKAGGLLILAMAEYYFVQMGKVM